jgi:hypothetical protein
LEPSNGKAIEFDGHLVFFNRLVVILPVFKHVAPVVVGIRSVRRGRMVVPTPPLTIDLDRLLKAVLGLRVVLLI